ncbi:MAG TPA: Uma2 family endonuclease, partial [Thermomicrobiales bacterium]|nr:Uma2 family endonuclease [Thermomicrobiales bacterium]
MVVQNRISEQAYLRIALRDPDGQWELYDGLPREKPSMSFTHNRLSSRLGSLLVQQLDWESFDVRVNAGRVRRRGDFYCIPDVAVIPRDLWPELPEQPGNLEVYDAPLPLVVEIWSPSTGSYDIGEKLAGYQQRGDQEIWRIHPYDRTLTTWRRRSDGGYDETVYKKGTVEPVE